MEKAEPKIDLNDGLICEYCEKVFRYKSHLTIHRRSHTGEKPYTCGYCGGKFGHYFSLKNHMMKNVCKQKPQKGNMFGCEVCGVHFILKSNLKRHILSQCNDKRPYTCDFCGANFNRTDNCLEHMRKKECIKSDLPDLEVQEEDLLNDILNLELEYHHKASEKHFQEAENVQPTEMFNQQSSHDCLFYQQASQPGPSEDSSSNYFPYFADPDGDTNINFTQAQGYNNCLYQDRRHFDFNNCHNISNQQTAQPDPLLNWEMTQPVISFNLQTARHASLLSQETVQPIPSQGHSFFYSPSSRLPEGIRNSNFKQEQGYKFLNTDDTLNFL